MLDRASERLLEWYYEQTVFGRSSMGAQLERARAVRLTDRVDVRATRRLRLAGEISEDERVFYGRAVSWPTEPVRSADGHIIGRRSAVTAQPTMNTRQEAGYAPSHRDLLRLAAVFDRIEAIHAAGDGQLVDVLETYYGPAGQHFVGTGLSQLFSVLELTASGAAFLKRMEALLAEERFRSALRDPGVQLQLKAGKLTEHQLRERTRTATRGDKPQPVYMRLSAACLVRSAAKYEAIEPLFATGLQQAGALYRAACAAWGAAERR